MTSCIKNVKIVKVHDTKFYCCEELQTKLQFGPKLDYWIKAGYKFCPYCGSKLR